LRRKREETSFRTIDSLNFVRLLKDILKKTRTSTIVNNLKTESS
jgi:hypothetical protein